MDTKQLETFRVQVLSDLHFDFHVMEVKADVLILAGDISNISHDSYESIIKKYASLWKNVIVILGNHEYHALFETMDIKLAGYKKVCEKYPNVYLLEKRGVVINGILFIGCTLWTNLQVDINDIRRMKIKSTGEKLRGLKKTDIVDLYQDSVDYLKKTLADTKYKVFVITHFPPISKNVGDPKWEDDFAVSYFSNKNLVENLNMANVKVWIYGHTHHVRDDYVMGTRYISNPVGHKSEKLKFKSDGLFTISL